MAKGRYYPRKKASGIPFEQRFFFFREGQPIPPGLKIVHKCVSEIECIHGSGREVFQRIKIDAQRLGYNGLVDCRYEAGASIHGIPARIVPQEDAAIYEGKKWNEDDFSLLLYSCKGRHFEGFFEGLKRLSFVLLFLVGFIIVSCFFILFLNYVFH